jgi:predicted DNA-binding transcriptional regulator YafY
VDQLGGTAAVEEADDGSIEVELVVTNRDGFRSFVLAFLEHAEVLGPPELRQEMLDHLVAMVGAR